MKIEFKSTARRVPHTDRFGVAGSRVQHVVEANLQGVTFVHDCNTAEEARNLVMFLSRYVGLE